MEATKDVVELRRCKLNVGEIVDLVTSPNCGAISTFVGTTRDNFESKKVVKLEYEAYEPMALKEMRNLCDKVRSRWNIERMAMYHRLGEVPVSEASIIIAISSPHRQDSLQAVQFAIDTLKSSVPIWKKEIYDGDEPQWKMNKECEIRKDSKITTSTTEFSVVKSEESSRIRVKDAASVAVSNCDVSDSSLVQIQASAEILNRRIQRFIERKREQVNMVNVQEFCCHRAPRDEEESSCARVDAILIRRKDSKSHVKVHRVSNPWGPQTVDPSMFYKTSIDAPSQNSVGYSFALEERLSTTENLIGITKPVPRDIYQRLKNIEDRVLHLESISPEYKDFWVAEGNDDLKTFHKPHRKRTYSTAELDMKLHELENRYAKKSK